MAAATSSWQDALTGNSLYSHQSHAQQGQQELAASRFSEEEVDRAPDVEAMSRGAESVNRRGDFPVHAAELGPDVDPGIDQEKEAAEAQLIPAGLVGRFGFGTPVVGVAVNLQGDRFEEREVEAVAVIGPGLDFRTGDRDAPLVEGWSGGRTSRRQSQAAEACEATDRGPVA
jgi:hypothetical protein